MKFRKLFSPLAMCISGATLAIVAMLGVFVAMPSLQKLPAGFSRTSVVEGSLEVAGAIPTTTPIDAEKTLVVDRVEGETAIVTATTRIFELPRSAHAEPISLDTHTFAIDRRTYQQAEPLPGSEVENQKHAAVFALPADPSRDGNLFYDALTGTAQPLAFAEETELHGRPAYRYTLDASGPITDPVMLQRLRAMIGKRFGTDGTTVPRTSLAALGIPRESIERLPENVPLTYNLRNRGTMVYDRSFGFPLSMDTAATTFAAFDTGPGLPLPALDLSTNKVTSSEANVADVVDFMNSTEQKRLIAHVILWTVAAGGLATLAVGAFRHLRRHGTSTTAEQSDSRSHLQTESSERSLNESGAHCEAASQSTKQPPTAQISSTDY
ncbi:MAG: hypothetical protein ACI9JD_003114 [Rhodococcus sp. (in: high G+C Gram-positive bacteria)]|jgi:hypothetical protein